MDEGQTAPSPFEFDHAKRIALKEFATQRFKRIAVAATRPRFAPSSPGHCTTQPVS
jgi:hypothetical protein